MTDSSTPPVDFITLHRFCAGECSAEEQARVLAWAAASPDQAAELEALQAIISTSQANRPTLDRLPDWSAMRTRLGVADHVTWRRPWIWHPTSFAIAGIAAVAALVIVMGRAKWHAPVSTSTESRTYVTGPGQRAVVMLSDGTELTLAPMTRIQLASDFGEVTRDLTLQGEALFVVTHDARHPFRVHARSAVAEDIGTTFDVRAYSDSEPVRVAVREGRVALLGESRPAPVRLVAGDLATMNGSDITVTRNANIAALTFWSQGGLSFDGTPLREVIRDLARTFDLDITLADSTLGARRITASFNDGASAEAALDVVTRVVGAQYQRSGRKVVIRRSVGETHGPDQGAALAPLRTASTFAPQAQRQERDP